MQLCRSIYSLSMRFPDNEKYGLTSQIRRPAVSVPSNIAEGFERKTKGDRKQFLRYALGSLGEVYTQLELAAGLGMINRDEAILEEIEQIRKMINSFYGKTR